MVGGCSADRRPAACRGAEQATLRWAVPSSFGAGSPGSRAPVVPGRRAAGAAAVGRPGSLSDQSSSLSIPATHRRSAQFPQNPAHPSPSLGSSSQSSVRQRDSSYRSLSPATRSMPGVVSARWRVISLYSGVGSAPGAAIRRFRRGCGWTSASTGGLLQLRVSAGLGGADEGRWALGSMKRRGLAGVTDWLGEHPHAEAVAPFGGGRVCRRAPGRRARGYRAAPVRWGSSSASGPKSPSGNWLRVKVTVDR